MMPNNYMFVTKYMLNLFHKSAIIWIYIFNAWIVYNIRYIQILF